MSSGSRTASYLVNMDWPQRDIDEYEKFLWRMNPPRLSIDNESSQESTLLKVDSANKPGILLEVVQMLADLDLSIHKAYISSDGGWFMDVFHVTDISGNKITDKHQIDYITQTMRRNHERPRIVGVQNGGDYTVIELTGTDRPGLLSEICALLTDLECNVVAAELWTHNLRVACLLHVTEAKALVPIADPEKLSRIKECLSNILKAGGRGCKGACKDAPWTSFTTSVTHAERRLHQLMLAERDYELPPLTTGSGFVHADKCKLKISVENCDEKQYSVVSIECRDRQKLLFDTLCAIADLDYAVFHAIIHVDGHTAYQEFYIRHKDGLPLKSEAERQRVIQCLRAAIDRRVSEGLRLELCTSDRIGLLSEVTRIFREHGLSVTRADVTTRDNKAVNVFYVTDAAGNPVEPRVVKAVRREIGQAALKVKGPTLAHCLPVGSLNCNAKLNFSIGGLLVGMPTQLLSVVGVLKSAHMCSTILALSGLTKNYVLAIRE